MQRLSSVYNQLAWVTCEGTLPGAAVILRDQAEDLYCTGYDYISQHLSELDLVKDCQRNPNPNNSSDWGKTGIRIRCEDQTQGLEGHVIFGQEVSDISVGQEM